MGVWCSCNGQKASIQYSGSAAPGAWIVEEGDCEGDGPCPWHYFGSVGYGGVWEVEAGKCFTGSLDFTLTTTSTDVGNCEPSSPTSKCVGKNVPYTFKATPNGTFSSCPKALIQGVEIR